MNFNKVLIGGNLTRDIELRFLPSGSAVASFGMAINRKWRDQTGQEKSEVTFVDVSAFGKQAETLAQYCKKGSPLFVEARLRTETWDDNKTGQKRSKLGLVCENFQFLGSKSDGTRAARPAETSASPAHTSSEPPPGSPDVDQDVPFN